jgi:hypothetical protein
MHEALMLTFVNPCSSDLDGDTILADFQSVFGYGSNESSPRYSFHGLAEELLQIIFHNISWADDQSLQLVYPCLS